MTAPSMGIKEGNTPAYCCPAGLKRMAKEFHCYPSQYQTNLEALIAADDEYLGTVVKRMKLYNELIVNVI